MTKGKLYEIQVVITTETMKEMKICEASDKANNDWVEKPIQELFTITIGCILDEAKREFPETDEFYTYNTKDIKTWFKKWLGDE